MVQNKVTRQGTTLKGWFLFQWERRRVIGSFSHLDVTLLMANWVRFVCGWIYSRDSRARLLDDLCTSKALMLSELLLRVDHQAHETDLAWSKANSSQISKSSGYLRLGNCRKGAILLPYCIATTFNVCVLRILIRRMHVDKWVSWCVSAHDFSKGQCCW